MSTRDDAQQTHHAECWRDPRHHACAVARAERLHTECVEQQILQRRIAILHAALVQLDQLYRQLYRDEIDIDADSTRPQWLIEALALEAPG